MAKTYSLGDAEIDFDSFRLNKETLTNEEITTLYELIKEDIVTNIDESVIKRRFTFYKIMDWPIRVCLVFCVFSFVGIGFRIFVLIGF